MGDKTRWESSNPGHLDLIVVHISGFCLPRRLAKIAEIKLTMVTHCPFCAKELPTLSLICGDIGHYQISIAWGIQLLALGQVDNAT